ncbi:SGNH/GDSL hydrolase family protein [Enterobacter sp. CGMCC 5087]|uniref:SGNH/GDSL hydrolase family protein n=1 Tax=Enterobacter sp. CGMCC 5087 TaxID=2183878 RepID=UPI00215ADB8F|nr:SGNH/GDSL hydrolase family protein [Enterobacter sp. CGMCC 5087]
MKNKFVWFSGVLTLLITELTLSSCHAPVDTPPAPVSMLSDTSDVMADYGESRVKRLAEKLRNSRRETTHILVMGDSHTAADFLSGQLRTMLQARYGNGGPGFVSPVKVPGNRYSHVNYTQASGWRLETSRRAQDAAFTLGGMIATPTTPDNVSRITVTDGETALRAQALYRSAGNATLRVGGNAVSLVETHGGWALSPAVPVAPSFSVSLKGSGTQLAGFWLTASPSRGVIVSALGINGAQISMPDKWPADWPGTLKRLSPDLVVLAYGTNEAFNASLVPDIYRQDLLLQIRKIRLAVPEAAILLIGPGSSIQHKDATGCRQRQSPVLKRVIEIQKQAAREEHTLFWDWFAFMGGDCAIEQWAVQGKARPDLVHLQAAGYREVADGLWKGLRPVLEP